MKTTLHTMTRRSLARLPLATAIHLACFAPVFAADTAADPADPQTTPSAQSAETKQTQLGTVTENAQDVPISMDVLSTEKLTEMNVADFTDYVKLLPSVATSSSQGAYSPGFGQVSMRGVESGSNGNHSGPSPSVSLYLDEQPITPVVAS